MNNETKYNINSYEELKNAKMLLRSEIEEQEMSFMGNPVFKISSSLFGGGSIKNSLKSSFESLSLDDLIKTGENLLSTVLMANKKTRKFFIAFTVAKEMVPFLLVKINEIFNHKEPAKK